MAPESSLAGGLFPRGKGFVWVSGQQVMKYKNRSGNTDWAYKPSSQSNSRWLEKKAARKLRKAAQKHWRKLAASHSFKDEFYRSWEWTKLRFEVLKTYGAVCMLCHSTDRIVVDHIKPRRKFPELAMQFDNLQVLCNLCNRGKSNNDYTDFRPKLPAPELEEPEMQHLKDIIGVS